MNIVITGASKGLGKAIALVYANEGNVLLLCSRDFSQLSFAAKTIKDLQLACHVHIFAADLSVKEGAEEFAEWCLTFGKIDILVNNAGQYFPGSIIEEQEGNLEKLMQVNVYSAYYLTRKLVPRMISAKSGHIFNMCSVASIKAFPNGGSYCISKFALLGFSKSLREELRQDNIKITSILPGFIL